MTFNELITTIRSRFDRPKLEDGRSKLKQLTL